MAEITLAGAADAEAIALLLRDLSDHYGQAAPEPALTEAVRHLSTPHERAGPFCLLARIAGEPAGFATLGGLFPGPHLSWGLFLEDLYVVARHRRSGLGRALISAAAGFAAERGYARLEWATDRDNTRARRFYASLGVPTQARLLYRVGEDVLPRAGRGDWPDPVEEDAP